MEPSQADERETAYDLLQRGEELLRRRHHAQAAIVLERANRLEPHRQSILEALGRAYFNSGQHELSRRTFTELLELGSLGLASIVGVWATRGEGATRIDLARIGRAARDRRQRLVAVHGHVGDRGDERPRVRVCRAVEGGGDI